MGRKGEKENDCHFERRLESWFRLCLEASALAFLLSLTISQFPWIILVFQLGVVLSSNCRFSAKYNICLDFLTVINFIAIFYQIMYEKFYIFTFKSERNINYFEFVSYLKDTISLHLISRKFDIFIFLDLYKLFQRLIKRSVELSN